MNQFLAELKSLVGWRYIEVALWILIPGVFVSLAAWGFEQYRAYDLNSSIQRDSHKAAQAAQFAQTLQLNGVLLGRDSDEELDIEQISAGIYKINSYDPWNVNRTTVSLKNNTQLLPNSHSSKVYYIDQIGYLIKSVDQDIKYVENEAGAELIVEGEFYISRGDSLAGSYKNLYAAAPSAFRGQSTVLGASEDFASMQTVELLKLAALDALNSNRSALVGVGRECLVEVSATEQVYDILVTELLGMKQSSSCGTAISSLNSYATDLITAQAELGYPYHINGYEYGEGRYLFGNSILVGAIDRNTTSWVLPEGRWMRVLTGGEVIEGGSAVKVSFSSLSELPIFIKEGAVMRVTSSRGEDELFGFTEEVLDGEIMTAQIAGKTRLLRMTKENDRVFLVDLVEDSRYPMRNDPYGKGFSYISLSELN